MANVVALGQKVWTWGGVSKKWKLWARLLDEEGDWSFRITLVPHVGYRDECGCSSSNGIIVPVGPEMSSDAEFCSC